MAKKSKMERVLTSHYRDMLKLNNKFIDSIARHPVQSYVMPQNMQKTKKKSTKKQLEALARGRKILALKRNQTRQI